MKAKEAAYQRLRLSQRSLLQSIRSNYGQQLDGFSPQVLAHFRDANHLTNPKHVLHLLAEAAMTEGVPALLGEPYALRLTPKFLAYLIISEGWIPDDIPPVPNPTGSAEDVSDSAAEARQASVEYSRALSASDKGKGQDSTMPSL